MEDMVITTDAGNIRVTVQANAKAYVQVGTSYAGEYAQHPLTLPRGVKLAGSSHYKRDDAGIWRPIRGFVSWHREDSSREPTSAMLAQVADIIGEALAANVSDEHISDVQRASTLADAASLREDARKLCAVVDELNRQASELEADPDRARIVYVELEQRSGFRESARAVQTASGELLYTSEPPSLSGTVRYGAAGARAVRIKE